MVLPRAVASLAALYLASASSGALSLVQMRAGPAARWDPLVAAATGTIQAHGVQVAHCETAAGNLRVFVEHWHGAGQTASAVDSITIQVTAGNETTVATVAASGVIANTFFASLPGCAIDTLHTDSGCGDANQENNWGYWDFTPNSCGIPTTVKLLQGNSVVFDESCGDLYPIELSVSDDFGCVNPTPAPTTSPPASSAAGDPHMVNIFGENFDVNRVGMLDFLRVPREAPSSKADLIMRAKVADLAATIDGCPTMPFIEAVHFGGSWLQHNNLTVRIQDGSMLVSVGEEGAVAVLATPISLTPTATLFIPQEGIARLQVHGAAFDILMDSQAHHFFLDLRATSLGSLGCSVGGLLGEDDHADISGNCPEYLFEKRAGKYTRNFKAFASLA